MKPKGIRALQEDERLKEANYLLRRVSKAIKDKMLLNEIKFCNNSYDFKGELDFEIDCYEKNRKNATLDIVLERLSSLELAKIETKMEIAARIEDEMIRRGWSKGDLMNAVGKNSPSIITSWLSGTHNFTIDTLVELEHALDISLVNTLSSNEVVKVATYNLVVNIKADVPKSYLEQNSAFQMINFRSNQIVKS